MARILVKDTNPVAVVLPYAGSVAPTGWLLCDGSAVSRTTYASLYASIGTTYGSGDGSTTFNLPDCRGIFVRGAGTHGTLNDANSNKYTGTLGGTQIDQMQGHYHPIGMDVGTFFQGATAVGSSTSLLARGSGAANGTINPSLSTPASDNTHGTPRTGTETRPANIALNYIIKA